MAKEEIILTLLRDISRSMTRIQNQIVAPYGITAIQMNVLHTLYMEDHLTMGELSEKCELSLSNLSAIIKRLEDHDFVKRIRDPHDRRSIRVVLTPCANHLADRLCEHTERKKHVFEQINKQDFEDILIGLQKLNEMLKEVEIDE